MSDQEKKQDTIPPRPDAENKKENAELSEEELKKVTGGVSDFTITKYVDKASPKLF
jgi:bacteriocin-like protein